jgi:tryptophan synthase alpha chain
MSRISLTINQKKADGKKVLIPYLVAGDPDAATTVALMHQLVADGADIIELGVPFSDPSSDGPVIQLGAERALRQGAGMHSVLDMVRQFRQQNDSTPIVLMGYLNPVEAFGYPAFVEQASAVRCGRAAYRRSAGQRGQCLAGTDPAPWYGYYLPGGTYHYRAASAGYLRTQLRLPLLRVSERCHRCGDISNSGEIAERVQTLRSRTDLPVVVGFGIKDDNSARAMASISDGVIVGSALVEKDCGTDR